MGKKFIFKQKEIYVYGSLTNFLQKCGYPLEGDQRLRTSKRILDGFQRSTVFKNSIYFPDVIKSFFHQWEQIADRFNPESNRFEDIKVYKLLKEFSPEKEKIMVLDGNTKKQFSFKRLENAINKYYSLNELDINNIWKEKINAT